jgi:hypothetical protein
MGESHGALHIDISIMIHQVPIPDNFYDSYRLVIHTWGWCEKYELIQRSQKVLTNLLVFHLVLVLPKTFAVYVDGFI